MTTRVEITAAPDKEVEVAFTEGTLRQTIYFLVQPGETQTWHVWGKMAMTVKELEPCSN